MKKWLGILVVAGLFLALSTVAFADMDKMCGHCPMKGKWQGHDDDEESYMCPITDKFMGKARFFLKNKAELGLSDEQVSQVKQLKMENKKAYIRQMAEFEVFSLEVQHSLSQPQVDADALNALIDQHTAAMTQGAKDTVADYVKLKAVLTAEQMTKAKELHSKM